MNKQNLAIKLCHFIKRKKLCFKYGGACGTCGSHEVIKLLKKIDSKKLENSLLNINETTPMILEYTEGINTLLSFFGKYSRVSNQIDTQAIRNNWHKYATNSLDCIYSKMLNGRSSERPKQNKNRTKYSFDGRSKYTDSLEEILIREEWYNR